MSTRLRFELSVSCTDLKDADFLSKSDPMVVLLRRVPHTKRYERLDRTEYVMNCLNPEFVKKFRLSVFAGVEYQLRLAVVDIDEFEKVDMLEKQEMLGRTDFSLSDLVSRGRLSLELSSQGFVHVRWRKYQEELDGQVELQLTNFEFSVPEGRKIFLEIHRDDSDKNAEDGEPDWNLVHRTQPDRAGSLQPPFELSLFTICLGDLQRRLRLSCRRHSKRGNHKLLGDCRVSLADMQRMLEEEPAPKLPFLLDGDAVGCVQLMQLSVLDGVRDSVLEDATVD